MKKIFVLCLFVVLSLGVFAQKLNTDGEAHFDQLIGIEEIAPINMKLKVYKKIYLEDEWGQLYAYDTNKKTLVLMESKENLNVMLYFRRASK